MADTYYTIAHEGEGKVTVKMSRFLSFAFPVATAEEARAKVKEMSNAYHDSRHVCWAYMLGAERNNYLSNDNGEPSGTAGRPILGRINSAGLTNVLVVVVRYFGGIKLGTPGLISAYGEAAEAALEAAGKKECHSMESLTIHFPYMAMNGVMKVLKSSEVEIKDKAFDNTCRISLVARLDHIDELRGRLLGVDGVTLAE